MSRSNYWSRRQVVTSISAISFSGITGCLAEDDTSDIQDADGDGVIDSKDYAPNDPDVQKESDITKSTGETPIPSPTPTATPTSSESNDRDGDGVLDYLDDYPDSAHYSERINSDSGREFITPGYYRWWSWSLESSATFSFEVDVISGSNIDALLIDESEFGEFEDGQEYSYYIDGSDLNTTRADKHLRILSGSYRFILSNYNVGIQEQAEVEYGYTNAR